MVEKSAIYFKESIHCRGGDEVSHPGKNKEVYLKTQMSQTLIFSLTHLACIYNLSDILSKACSASEINLFWWQNYLLLLCSNESY